MNDEQALEQIGVVTEWLNSDRCDFADIPDERNYARMMSDVRAHLEKRLKESTSGDINISGGTNTLYIYNQ